jgi:Na+-transporting methylmalonyl-CoA/oxaloacetate decarboxylase gamma subunit
MNALTLCIIDMIIVFAVLYGLALIIKLIKFIASPKQQEEVTVPPSAKVPTVQDEGDENLINKLPQETLAVIAAAAFTYLDDKEYMITTILPYKADNAWKLSGRQDLIAGRQTSFRRYIK